MARKTSNFTITDDNRDRGKVFVLTELPASRAESWAMRALLALTANGVEVPDGFENMGMSAMAEIGIKALNGLKWQDLDPLLKEMWECVQFMPDPAKPQVVRKLFEDDIEEVSTMLAIRLEVWKLHTDFLNAVGPSIFQATPAPAAAVSLNTKT